jgi:hypothetical protein
MAKYVKQYKYGEGNYKRSTLPLSPYKKRCALGTGKPLLISTRRNGIERPTTTGKQNRCKVQGTLGNSSCHA